MPLQADIRFLVLMVTSRCNLACSYCYAGADGRGRDMSWQTAQQAMELVRAQPRSALVELAGGEPLLNFDLIRRLLETYGKDTRFALQSNGLLLDKAKLDFLAEHGVGLGLSLDGPPRINDLTRGSSSRVLQALELLNREGAGVNLTVVLSRHNVESIPELILLCARYRAVRVINLDLLRTLGRAHGAELQPTPAQIAAMVPEMLAALAFVNQRRFPPLKVREVEQTIKRAAEGQARPYCFAAQGQAAAVSPDGRLHPCACLAGHEDFAAGTVQHPDVPALGQLSDAQGLDPRCADCPILTVCRGGCPSRRVSFNASRVRRSELECTLRRTLYSELVGPVA